MTDVSGQGFYRNEPIGVLMRDPLDAPVVATYSTTGPVWTPSAVEGRSHPGALVAVTATGVYTVSGLPRGRFYTVLGLNLLPPTSTLVTGIYPTVRAGSLDPAAGTCIVETRRTDSGALAAPSNATELHLTLRVETGVGL